MKLVGHGIVFKYVSIDSNDDVAFVNHFAVERWTVYHDRIDYNLASPFFKRNSQCRLAPRQKGVCIPTIPIDEACDKVPWSPSRNDPVRNEIISGNAILRILDELAARSDLVFYNLLHL
jgi:hypothetical protein